MEVDELKKTLHPFERRLVPLLKEGIEAHELETASGLKDVEVMRGLQWLENKGCIKIIKEGKTVVSLATNGHKYAEDCLPEKKALEGLQAGLTRTQLQQKYNLDDQEFTSAIGLFKKKNIISVGKDITIVADAAAITAALEEIQQKETLLKMLANQPAAMEELSDQQRTIIEEFKQRKDFIAIKVQRYAYVQLTETGRQLQQCDLSEDAMERLTKEMLATSSWKGKAFRQYDVAINVPAIKGGRKHPMQEAMDYARSIWLAFGFEEMRGPLIETAFWNFDALFVPQDHPAREMQDTFFLNRQGSLPANHTMVERVKATHQDGWTTGSKGWRYAWDEKKARQLLLRTHTTSLSARTLASLKPTDLPAKFFSVGKVFRNETLDWSHLLEFVQTEGIVIGDVNFQHLLGYLHAFFEKMGYEKSRFRPGYFPYTECSVEVEVLSPAHNKWIELGAAGIFRPEVTKPLLGFETPVLAWGLGFDRIVMESLGLTDLRDIYTTDIQKLNECRRFFPPYFHPQSKRQASG